MSSASNFIANFITEISEERPLLVMVVHDDIRTTKTVTRLWTSSHIIIPICVLPSIDNVLLKSYFYCPLCRYVTRIE